MALKGMQLAPKFLTCSNGEVARNSKEAHLSLLHQHQNIQGNDSTVQSKTKHTQT